MPGQTPPRPMMDAAPLQQIVELTGAQIDTLRGYWIDSVQEFLAVEELPGGRGHLRNLLGVDDEDLERLIKRGERVLGVMRGGAQDGDAVMDFDYGTGALEPPAAERDAEAFDAIPFAGELPASIHYADIMPSARNQGIRGTCVAHAAAAVRELLEIQAGATKADEVDLSEEFIYWWCKEQDRLPTVSGTYPHLGIECLAKIGTVTEEVWEYDPEQRSGDEGHGPPPDDALGDAEQYRLKRAYRLDPKNVTSIKNALANGKGMLFAIPVFNSWYANRNTRRFGKIIMPLPGEQGNGAHAMALIGYVDDEDAPGGGYFVLRNSWSPWGTENPLGPGYGTIPYAFIARHNMAAHTGDRASRSDIYIRDNADDKGEVPSEGPIHDSPDIWVRLAEDGEERHQMPQAGEECWIYVRAWNLGPDEAADVQATIFQAPASTSIWPRHWQEIGQVEFPAIAAGQSATDALAWTPPDDGPFAFLVRLSSPDDAVQQEGAVREDNNIAQKNLVILQAKPGEKAEFAFAMYGLPGQLAQMDLEIDRRAFRRGRVELRMAERGGSSGDDRLVEDAARLAELTTQATESEKVGVAITPDASAEAGESSDIILTQRYGRYLVGRLTVRVEIIA
ncbi:MAG: C1 family peptidase [Caldilineales bacterium]|nr:C1 family peptidase [Caldilineales bacterium]